MRFVADAMLGRLARWLRLAGFDTLYFRDITDGEILRTAKMEGRLMLTRDTRLAERAGGGGLLLKSDHTEGQFLQVLSDLGHIIPGPPRCAACNGALGEVADREEVRDLVPEHVYHSAGRFERCSGCGNIYWEGSHHREFSEKIASALARRRAAGGAGR